MITVGLYEGKGSTPARLRTCLEEFGFRVCAIQEQGLSYLSQQGIDVLYLPGGWYSFDKDVNTSILAWVRSGGGCVSTCAGSYLVAGHIPLVPGRALRSNFRGRLYLEPQQGGHPILKDVVHPCTRHDGRPNGEPIAVTHLGGPLIFPEDRRHIVASYDAEGEVGAIVAADVGLGRAVAIASHPELELADLPHDDYAGLKSSQAPALLPQGDARLLIRNSVLWAARREA